MMLELLPPYLRQYSEMKEIMNVESLEIETITDTHNQIVDNRYIEYCNEYGISRFESLLGIMPLSNDTLEDRKLRCLTKWNQKLPYNYVVLCNKLADLCGEDGYEVSIDFSGPVLYVKLALGVKNQFSIVQNMVESMVPCNVLVIVNIMYNTYEMLSEYTHEQLAAYTHEGVREVNL